MAEDTDIRHRFPTAFWEAAEAVLGQGARHNLRNALRSIDAGTEPSEVAARAYMQGVLGLTPFLNEKAIRSLVHKGGLADKLRVVDFVACLPGGSGLVLVEAKASLDAAEVRGGKMVEKFVHTQAQLAYFCARGKRVCPPMARAIVTAKEVHFSGSSGSAIEDGKLTRHGAPVRVGAAGLSVEIVVLDPKGSGHP